MAARGPRVCSAAMSESSAQGTPMGLGGGRSTPTLGFVCVYRDAVGRVRLRLLTSRRALEVEADVCVSDSLEATSDCERIRSSVGVA